MSTPTIASPSPVAPAERPYLSAPKVPADASILPPARDAVTDDDAPDCEDCDNTGRPFAGYFGGVTRFHDGCQACGREGQS
jgi:hypothetical protein